MMSHKSFGQTLLLGAVVWLILPVTGFLDALHYPNRFDRWFFGSIYAMCIVFLLYVIVYMTIALWNYED